jgi:uncharacterized protein
VLIADLEIARAYLEHNPPPGSTLVCAITGAHLYGFPSPDSDLDLKGIHLVPTASLLGLNAATPPHDHTEIFQGVECDLTTNEAGDALRLLLAGNGNMLERILSPLQVVTGGDLDDLRELATGSISVRYARHYSGFFRGRRRELGITPTVKSLLYAYRVALTGIHLLHSGELEANLPRLLELSADLAALRGDTQAVLELIELKGRGPEHGTLEPRLLAAHDSVLDSLAESLLEAERDSSLPSEAENRREIDAWLVHRRRAHDA